MYTIYNRAYFVVVLDANGEEVCMPEVFAENAKAAINYVICKEAKKRHQFVLDFKVLKTEIAENRLLRFGKKLNTWEPVLDF